MKRRKKKPYFESWYFREQAGDFTCAFTVLIDYDEEGRMTGHLDVAIPDGQRHLDYAHPVNMNLRGSLFLVLDKNVFTEACIHLDIDEPDLTIKGDIYFDRDFGGCRVGLRRNIWAMEQVLSGELTVNGREISFDGGKGYLEETRGLASAAPADTFRTQCNWFGDRSFRILCGADGDRCFAVIDQDGYPIRLAWWKGAKLEYLTRAGFRMRQRSYVLECWRSEETCESCLDQTVRYRLTCKGDVLFDEISTRAGYTCDINSFES
ncbi:MAG: hypothetical protein IKJ77_09485 [Firmicutes bacterium]|nr:hypothetical protein [Bacillota bacterium]